MATKSKRHIHKYHKVQLAFARVWACALPDCLHYLPQHMEELATGKQSICWGCSNRMILNPDNMKHEKPTCEKCAGITDVTDAVEKTDVKDFSDIEKAFIDSGIA